MRHLALVVSLVACGSEPPPITIVAPAEIDEAMRELVALTPYDGRRLAPRQRRA